MSRKLILCMWLPLIALYVANIVVAVVKGPSLINSIFGWTCAIVNIIAIIAIQWK